MVKRVDVSCYVSGMKDQRSFLTENRAVADLCRRWKIARLALFGSMARNEAKNGSDIDLLVDFAPGADWSLLDLVNLKEEFEALLGSPVDVIERRALRNPYRLHSALQDEIILHAA
jgi:predicted nucleotidyltransferase